MKTASCDSGWITWNMKSCNMKNQEWNVWNVLCILRVLVFGSEATSPPPSATTSSCLQRTWGVEMQAERSCFEWWCRHDRNRRDRNQKQLTSEVSSASMKKSTELSDCLCQFYTQFKLHSWDLRQICCFGSWPSSLIAKRQTARTAPGDKWLKMATKLPQS